MPLPVNASADVHALHDRSFAILRNNASTQKTNLDNLIGRLGILESEVENHFVESSENRRDEELEALDFRQDAIDTVRSRMNDIYLLLHSESRLSQHERESWLQEGNEDERSGLDQYRLAWEALINAINALQQVAWSSEFPKRDQARIHLNKVLQDYARDRRNLVQSDLHDHDPAVIDNFFQTTIEATLQRLERFQSEERARTAATTTQDIIEGETATHLRTYQDELLAVLNDINTNEYWRNQELQFSDTHEVVQKAQAAQRSVRGMCITTNRAVRLRNNVTQTFSDLKAELDELSDSMRDHLADVPTRPRNAQINTLVRSTREQVREALGPAIATSVTRVITDVRRTYKALFYTGAAALAVGAVAGGYRAYNWATGGQTSAPDQGRPAARAPLNPPSMRPGQPSAPSESPAPTPEATPEQIRELKINELQTATDIDRVRDDLVQLKLPAGINTPGKTVKIMIEGANGFEEVSPTNISPDLVHHFDPAAYGTLPNYKFIQLENGIPTGIEFTVRTHR